MRFSFARLCVLQVLEADPQRWIEGGVVFKELISRETALSLATVYHALKDLNHHGMLIRRWCVRIGANNGKIVCKLKPE